MSSDRVTAFFWLLALFFVQNAVNYLFPGKCPPLLLMAVIFYSLREGAVFGLTLGAAAGFLLELFGQGVFGIWILNLAAVGALSGYVSSKIFQDSLLTEILLPGLAFYLSTLAEILVLQGQAGAVSGWQAVGRAFLFWPLAGSLLFSPLLFSWLQKTSSSRRGARPRNVYR